MANFVADTFTDTDSTALTAHTPDTGGTWTVHGSSIGTPTVPIVSNKLDASSWGLYGAYYNTATPPSADYVVAVDVQTDGTSDTTSGGGVFARLSSSATLTGYLVRLQAGRLFFQKFVSGTATTLGSQAYSAVSNQDYRLYLSCIGTTISVKCQRLDNLNWINSSGVEQASETNVFSVTDSSVTLAAFAGIAGRNAIYGFDNYAAGDDGTLSSTFEETVTSTMTFVENLNGLEELVVDDLSSLAGEITFFNVEDDREVPETTLALVSTVIMEGLIQGEGSTLSLSGLAVGELFGQPELADTLGISDVATGVLGVPHSAPWGVGGVAQTLSFVSDFTTARPASASNTLTLTDEAIASYGLDSTLAFVSTVSGGISHPVEQDLGITQVISRAGSEWVRSATSSMTLSSSANAWSGDDKCFRRLGSSNVPIAAAGDLTLTSLDGAYSIVLRNPETDNSRRTAFDRVLRETRGGDLIVFRDTGWNVVQTLLFTITAIKTTTLSNLQTFFLNTLGKEISLTDWLGEEWTGVVTRPDETFTEDRDGYWTFAFEFEGSKADGSFVYQNLGLTQEVSQTVVP